MNNTFFKSFVLHKSNSKSPKEMWHDASTTDKPELDQFAKKITQMKYQKVSAEQYECTTTVLRGDE